MKIFLPIYLLAYFLAAFLWRSYVVWKRSGINPVVFKGADTAHDFIGLIFKLLFGTVVVVVLLNSLVERLDEYLTPIRFLRRRWVHAVGLLLLIMSFGWTILAQSQMGESWRIGIDSEHRTTLISRGAFSISRNPIFVGMMITLFGLLLVLPNVVTLITFVMGAVLINVQVRLEEDHLRKVHGEEYKHYKERVRRWLGASAPR